MKLKGVGLRELGTRPGEEQGGGSCGAEGVGGGSREKQKVTGGGPQGAGTSIQLPVSVGQKKEPGVGSGEGN